MPRIIDYPIVLDRLTGEGLVCNYFNGGAFGFPPKTQTQIRGWIGPPDSTIQPAARPLSRNIPPPYEDRLTDLAVRAWREILPGSVWVMPSSHWAFELTHGNGDWLPALLQSIDVDPGLLTVRTDAAALEFAPDEIPPFHSLIHDLLKMLSASQFFLAFPGRATICTVHHHRQLWWVTTAADVVEQLDGLKI